MADSGNVAHRAGAFKQQNKTHKHGKHRSKGMLEKGRKGKIGFKSLSKRPKHILTKQDRKNQLHQERKRKREEVLAKKRNRGSANTPPHLVAIVALCDGIDVDLVVRGLDECDENLQISQSPTGLHHVSVARFKKRFAYLTPRYGDLYAMLDAAKLADSMLFLLSPTDGIDQYGEFCLSCLFAQGLPASLLAAQGVKNLPAKKQNDAKKYLQKCIENWFPREKVHSLDSEGDDMLLIRLLGEQKLIPLHMREHRPNLIAEQVEFIPNSNEDTEKGTVKITGYVRSQPLSVNRLVHVPGWGDFQLSQIDSPNDPYPLNPRVDKKKSSEAEGTTSMEEDIKLLETADPVLQESLQSEVIPDPMEGEQTWPTEEEMASAEAESKQKKKVHLVPKGTSEYQAAWIIDKTDDQDDEYDTDSETDSEISMEDEESVHSSDEEQEEMEEVAVGDGNKDEQYDANVDMEAEFNMLEKYKAARMDQMFPDEVDTPQTVQAKERFARYRGLKSFRTSPWDPKENLPTEYARIFQFEHFVRTKRRILAEQREEGALPGWYVTIHVKDVPKSMFDSLKPNDPLIVFGLLPHEQKMSVVHLLLQRHPDNNEPIKSKDRMIFHVGYRRFAACPIYSEHSNSNKHKFERFLKSDTTYVATVYAPIIFPPASVLMFKERYDGSHTLIATGSVMSVNPDRIITKRVVLSGHPFKINRKMAVVRYMFFNRDDISWFKPVELHTKYGRRGHIKEPLGTHGHMKCVFDAQLKSQDTVLMNLYKRMYPKWTYDPYIVAPPASTGTGRSEEEELMHEEAMKELFD
ncbi:pre-rRNA-processing protein TSR1 homolog [Tubulanus polymorphus]|uniref:pre-rRNA-processing protein TSR1 homolog n=1 Tax=Tubulanus polymorphus TaxID=672921 RepID=UPI003DA49D02